VLAIENHSTAMYFDFKDGEHIKETIHSKPLYADTKERMTTQRDGLNNITYTCSKLDS
jgi:hypothetical protein